MQSVFLPDHIPVNNYELIVLPGPAKLECVTISGLEEEIEMIELPDRTRASGGNVKPFSFTISHPKHHIIEDAFMEQWFQSATQPILPGYKRPGSLIIRSVSNLIIRTFNMIGMWPSKRTTPDLDMNNEGELYVTEWEINCDRIIPI